MSVIGATGSFGLGLVAGGLGIVVVNWVLHRLLIRRTFGNPLMQVLLTIGIVYIIAEIALLIWGVDPTRRAACCEDRLRRVAPSLINDLD